MTLLDLPFIKYSGRQSLSMASDPLIVVERVLSEKYCPRRVAIAGQYMPTVNSNPHCATRANINEVL